jgi:hypothetical protein
MFFNSPDFDLDGVVAGTFTLLPPPEMHALLERDYAAMAMMITGVVPPFADVMKAIGVLEQRLNAVRERSHRGCSVTAAGHGSPTSRPMMFATNPPRAFASPISARIRHRISSAACAFVAALMVCA